MRHRVKTQPEGELLVEMVVMRLKAQRYLNDTNYARATRAFARKMKSSAGYAWYRISRSREYTRHHR